MTDRHPILPRAARLLIVLFGAALAANAAIAGGIPSANMRTLRSIHVDSGLKAGATSFSLARARTSQAWAVEFAPSPPITTSVDSGGVPLRSRIDAIRLSAPVLRSDLAGAGEYWESRIECEGVGFDDFADAHFSYRTQGWVRVPASLSTSAPGQVSRTVAVYFHGGYDPVGYKEIGFLPDAAIEGDRLVGAPALARGLAYASFNLAGWDDQGELTARMLEPAGLAHPTDPADLVDPASGRLSFAVYGMPPLQKDDVIAPQTVSVARDLTRATKQAVVAVAGMAGVAGWSPATADGLPTVIVGHSYGGYLVSGIALGVNPWRPGVPSGGNRLDPADPSSPPIAVGAIPLTPAVEFYYADPDMPRIPMIVINGETDGYFGVQFTVAARYREVLARHGLGLADRLSLWALGNTAHSPPEVMDEFARVFGSRQGGDRWGPFVDAALGHIVRVVSAEAGQRMPTSHYDGRFVGGRLVFPQPGVAPTSVVPFVVDPRWDRYDGDYPPPWPDFFFRDFAAVARELEPTGHLLGPRMANPIGGYRIDFDGAELIAPFDDLARRYGTWQAYLERSQASVTTLVQAGVYVAPRGNSSLTGLLDPAAFDAFAEQCLVEPRRPKRDCPDLRRPER